MQLKQSFFYKKETACGPSLFMFGERGYPKATSSTIITRKPRPKPAVPARLWA